jgi:hypothetical protein
MLEQYDLHDYQVSRERALGCAHARSLSVYVCSNSMIYMPAAGAMLQDNAATLVAVRYWSNTTITTNLLLAVS